MIIYSLTPKSDASLLAKRRNGYKEIIESLLPYFDALYQFPYFRKLYTDSFSNTTLPRMINSGDCFIMAIIVEQIAKSRGLSPVINAGSWHVFVVDAGYIFDAYFPNGIGRYALANLRVNMEPMDEDPSEPPFYFGGPIGRYAYLKGYFNNNPARAVFAESVLRCYGLRLPEGLRSYLGRREVKLHPHDRDNTKVWVARHRRHRRDCNAVRRLIKSWKTKDIRNDFI